MSEVVMKMGYRLRWLAVFACLGAAAASAQGPSDLQQAMRERHRAIAAADSTTWDRLTSDDFTVVDVTGRLSSKAERLAALKREKPQTTAMNRSEEQVTVYGDAAIERVRVSDYWVIQVWIRQPQGWQVVATQLTTAAEK